MPFERLPYGSSNITSVYWSLLQSNNRIDIFDQPRLIRMSLTKSGFFCSIGKYSWILLSTLAAASALLYWALANLDAINGREAVFLFWAEMSGLFVLYAIAYYILHTVKEDSNRVLFIILLSGSLFRIVLLPAGLGHDSSLNEKVDLILSDLKSEEVVFERFQLFDSDIWRYLWDGHVIAKGFNPYQFAPSEEALDRLIYPISDKTNFFWEEIRENVNYGSVPTVYPPAALWVFWLSHGIAPGSVLVMKLIFITLEMIGILFLVGCLRALNRSTSDIILYAWNPLMIKVFAGSGHMDAIVVCFLSATSYFLLRKNLFPVAVSFALAILTKFSPVILLPFILLRIGWKYVFLIGLLIFFAYLPYLSLGSRIFEGFFAFSQAWQFNAGVFGMVQWLISFVSDNPSEVARLINGLIITGLVLWLSLKDDRSNSNFFKASTTVMGALFILSPTVMPWYISWVLPFALLSKDLLWFAFSILLLLAFHIMIDQNEYSWVLSVEFGLFFLLMFIQRQTSFTFRPGGEHKSG